MIEPDGGALLRQILLEDRQAFVHKVFHALNHAQTFKPNWHHLAMLHALARVQNGEINRLIITLPPRNLKSIIGSVAWPALLLGLDPSLSIICASYSNELALKFSRDCRAVMMSDWYRSLFPGTVLSRERNSEAEFMTTRRGGRMATSVGGTLTGRGGDILIIDDPLKPDEAMSETARRNVLEWFGNTVVSRLNDKVDGSIVVIMQRLHEEDLAGHLLEQGGWEHLSLPAIADQQERVSIGPDRFFERLPGSVLHPAHEPLSALEQIKHAQGSYTFSAQYQQQPVPAEGMLVRREWLRRYTVAPTRARGDQVIQSWDTASKDGALNDWSVCITALRRKRRLYVLDVLRAKLTFPQLRSRAIRHARASQADVLLIEDAASGTHLLQQLRHDAPSGVPRPIRVKPDGDKVTRMSVQTHQIEAGQLLLPKDAPWLAAFEHELLGFPGTKHDDQVDALAQLLAWKGRASRDRTMIAGPIVYSAGRRL